MGLLEFIKNVGENNITVQAVNNSFVKSKDKKREKCTDITFTTTEISTDELMNNKGKVGLIVWVSRDDYNKYLG